MPPMRTVPIAADLQEAVATALENADPFPPLAGTAAGTLVVLMGLKFRGEDGRGLAGAFLAALAGLCALVVALYASDLAVGLPPKVFRDWTVVAAAVGVLAGTLMGGKPASRVAGLLIGAGALVYLFAVPTESLHERYWDGQVALYVGALAGAGILALLVRLGQTAQGRSAEGMLAFAISASMAAPVVGLTGTGVSAGLAGALAGAAGVFGLLLAAQPALRERTDGVGRAAAMVQVIALAGVLGTGVLYAETPKWSGAVLLLAPTLTLLPGKSVPASLVRLALVAGACLVPVIAALLDQEPANPYGGY